MNNLTEQAIEAIEHIHLLRCNTEDMKKCSKNHHTLILGLKNRDFVLENQIRAKIVEELKQVQDLMVLTNEPENDTAAWWIKYAFDRAIGSARGRD
jgi:hypothetical protein